MEVKVRDFLFLEVLWVEVYVTSNLVRLFLGTEHVDTCKCDTKEPNLSCHGARRLVTFILTAGMPNLRQAVLTATCKT